MIGTLANTATILIGSAVGSVLKKGLDSRYEACLFNACGLAACGIGINAVVSNMPKSQYPVLFIVSLVLGSLVGTRLDLDKKFNDIVSKRAGGNLAQGLSTAILLFCIGTLSIVGPVMSALYQDHTFLFTNATLDLVTSMVLASTYGFGIALSALVLFCWQGSIYLLTMFVSGSFFSDTLVCELCVVGGFLIACTGLSILQIKNLKALNLLPALFVPILFFLAKSLLGF